MSLEAGKLVGRKYRLERLIASGGMGAVWEARHEQLGVPVAVKLIASSLAGDPAARARFEREARAAAQLRSPHVVQVLDYGIDDDLPYMAMEMLRGEDLAARIARRGRLSPRRAARILGDVAKAVALAHDAGIVHRDLKPRNVFLARVGDDEVVKVCDFGIAKELRPGEIAARDETATGTLLGSPHYMSPEQARGGRVDQRSDLWSMGVLAFEAITGRRPFVGDNMGDVIVRICTDPVPAVSQGADGLPAELDGFFARALAREPSQRFASARELAEALQAIAVQTAEDEDEVEPASAGGAARVEVPGTAHGTAERSVAGRLDATRSLATPPPADTLQTGALARERDDVAQQRARRRNVAIGRAVLGAALGAALLVHLWQRSEGDSAHVGAEAAPDAPSIPAAAAPAATATARAADGEASAPPPSSGTASSSTRAVSAATADHAPGTSAKASAGSGGPARAAAARPPGTAAPKASFDPFSGLPVTRPAASSRPRD
jgi:eukaryotic-like serine/threonine-protein kinase